MHNLIQLRATGPVVADDDWVPVESPVAAVAAGRPLVPLKAALADPEATRGLPEYGLLLSADDDPRAAGDLLARAKLVAVDFPAFTDGRGYSIANLLRTRLGYTGDLRAVGDVGRDQLFYLRRVGFTSFAIRPDRGAADALAGLGDFSDSYQASVEPALPAFRRHAPGAGA